MTEPVYLLLLLIAATSWGSVELRFARGAVSNHINIDAHHNEEHHDHHDHHEHGKEDLLEAPHLRVDNNRILIEGTNSKLVLNKIRLNVENWVLTAVGPMTDDVRIKLLENGSVYVSNSDKDLRSKLQQKVRELLENHQEYLNTVDPTKPLTPPSSAHHSNVQITDDGNVLISGADDYEKETIKKQIEELLNSAKIVPSNRFRFYIRPDGSVSSFGSFNPREKELVERSVRNWLKKNKDFFKNYDPQNPPKQNTVSPVSVTVRPDGSVDIQTKDPKERQVVISQVLEWLGKHLPSVPSHWVTIDSTTGQFKVTGKHKNVLAKYIKNLLLKSSELFRKYDPAFGLPHDVQNDVRVEVTDDGRILIESPDCLEDSLSKAFEDWLLSAFPGLADKIKFKLLDDGTVQIVGNVPESTKKLIKDRLFTIIDGHRDEIENYPNTHQLPELDGGVAVYVQNDGHILIEGSDYVKNEAKQKIQEWLRTAFPKLSNSIHFVILDNGAVDVVGTNDNELKEKLRRFVKLILLEYAQDLETFDPLVGLEPIKPTTKLSVTNDGRLMVEVPGPLKKTVVEAVQDWLLTFLLELKGKVQIVLLSNGAVEVDGPVDATLKENAKLVLKDMLLNNKAAVVDFDITKPLLTFGWKPEVSVTDDGRLVVTGPPNLVTVLKQLLQNWLQSYFPSLNGKGTLKIQDDGQVTVNGNVEIVLKNQVQILVKSFLSDNKLVVEKLSLLTEFSKLDWKSKVTVSPEGKVLIEGPASLKKLTKQLIEDWLTKYLPKLPGVNLTVELNDKGELVVGGTNDQVLKDKVKFYLEDLIKNNSKVFLNFDVTRPLPVFKWQPEVTVTNDGKVNVDGPESLKSVAKQLIEPWFQDFLPNLKGKFSVKVLPDGTLQIDGELDDDTKKAVKAFFTNLLLNNKSVFDKFSLFDPLPKLDYQVKVVVDQNGRLLVTGPPDLVKQAKEKLQNWLLKFFPTLQGIFTVAVQDDGSVDVNGSVDDLLKSKIMWFIKDLLLNNVKFFVNYDPITPLKTFEWTVSTKVTDDGKLVVVSNSNGLKNKVKETVLEWVRKNFPDLDSTVKLVLDDTGDVLVTGPVTDASKAEIKRDVLELFLNNKYVLNTWDWFKPLAVTVSKGTISLENGNVKITGPSSKKNKIKQDFLEWLRKLLPINDVNVRLDLNDNGQVVVTGTPDVALAERIKGFLGFLLKNNKDAVDNYNKDNKFPNLDWTPKFTLTADVRVLYSGPEALKNTVDNELNNWLQAAFLQLGKEITYKRGSDGAVTVEGTNNEVLKAKLTQYVKDFLLAKKETLENYNILYGFPDPAWNLLVSVGPDGKLTFTGPNPLADVAKNDVQKWLKQAFPSLNGNVNFVVLVDGSVDVVGVLDETLKNRLKQVVKDVLTAKKSDIERYTVFSGLAPLDWKVLVKVEQDGRVNVSGPTALVNLVLQDFAKWARSAFPNLDASVQVTFDNNGEVVVTGANNPALVEKLKQLVKSLLLAFKPDVEAYDGFKVLPKANFNVSVNVLPNGDVTFDGVPLLVNNAKKDFLDWIVQQFPSLASKLVLNGNQFDLVNENDPVQKKKKLDLVKLFVAFNVDVLKKYDPLTGFPAPNRVGTLTVGPGGSLVVNNPSPLTEYLLLEVSKWVRLAFVGLDTNVVFSFSSNGDVTVTGTNDPALVNRLKQLVKTLLETYKAQLDAYDGFKELPKPEFNVNVSAQLNGVVTFVGSPVLVNNAKKDFIDWLVQKFPSLLSKLVLNGDQVDLVGFENPEEKKKKLDLVKLFLDNNLEVLKKYQPWSGFQAPNNAGTVTVTPDGRLVVNSASPLTNTLLQHLAKWVRLAFPSLDANISISFSSSGELVVTGTSDSALVEQVERLRQLVKSLLLNYKSAVEAYDGFNNLPNPEFTVNVSVQQNGVVTFDGSAVLVGNAKKDFLDWLGKAFPKFVSKFVLNGNQVDLVGVDNAEEKKKQLDLVKLFLENNLEVLKKYQPLTGFPAPNKVRLVTLGPDGSVVVNNPSSLTNLLLNDISQWVRSAFPSLDANIRFQISTSGEIIVTGTNDQTLIERLKLLVRSFLQTYKVQVETYDGSTSLPTVTWSAVVTVTADGRVTFSGPAATSLTQSDFLKWLKSFFPNVNVSFTLSESGVIGVTGTTDQVLVARLLVLVQQILTEFRTDVTSYDVVRGFKSSTWKVNVTLNADGTVKATGSPGLVTQFYQDLAKWITASFPTLPSGVTISFTSTGSLQVTGVSDPSTLSQLQQLFKEFLNFNLQLVQQYDNVNGFVKVNWKVQVNVQANGSFQVSAPQPLLATVKAQLVAWLNQLFAPLQGRVTFTLQDNGEVVVGGSLPKPLTDKVQQFLAAYLLSHNAQLSAFSVFTPLPVDLAAPSISVTNDGRILLTGPEYWTSQARSDLQTWIQSSVFWSFSATVTITSSGVIEIGGTTNAALLAEAKAKLLALLATYKTQISAYNLFTPLPKVEIKLVVNVDSNFGISVTGPNSDAAKQNILQWIVQSFPSLAGKFTLEYQPNGQVVVATTKLSDTLKAQLQSRVTLLIKQYQAQLNAYTLDAQLPKVAWEVTVTVRADNSFKIDGPEVLTAKTRQQIVYVLIKNIPKLDGNIEIDIQDNGQVLILGTADEALINNIRTEIMAILKSTDNLLINVVVDVPVNSGPIRRMVRRRSFF